LTSNWEHNLLISEEKLQPRLVWSAQLTDIADKERTHCRLRHISRQVLQQTWSAQNKRELIEMILRFLKISGVGLRGLSQQIETQHDIPLNFLYALGGWLRSFVFEVTSNRFDLKDNLHICPNSLVEHVCTTMLPITFQPFHIGG